MAISHDPEVPPKDEMEAEIREAFDMNIDPEQRCFVCFDLVRHPAIYWRGEARNIWMHPSCTARLIRGLALDLATIQEWQELARKVKR